MVGEVSTVLARLAGNRVVVAKQPKIGTLHPKDSASLEALKKRDEHVRGHEANHTGAPGVITIGSPNYSFQIGPDGKPYAVGGKVTLATVGTKNPTVARERAGALKRAALANGDPSPQDLAAASSARDMENEASLQEVTENEAKSLAMHYKEMERSFRASVPQESLYNGFA